MTFLTVCNDTGYFLRHWRHAADDLASQGHQVIVLTGGENRTPDDAEWHHVHQTVERFRFSPWLDLTLMMKIGRLLFTHRPESLHAITLKPVLFGGLAALIYRGISGRKLRIVASLPGLGRLFDTETGVGRWSRRLSQKLTFACIRHLAQRPDVLFTFETGKDLRFWQSHARIADANAWVMRGVGVDDRYYFPVKRETTSSPLKVLFASRLLRSKGLDVYIEAARQFQLSKRFEFLVAGMNEPEDPDAIASNELAQETAIRFLGEVSDMPSLLHGVDIVCLPTRYGEGVPRILIEAAACGLPAIAGNAGGCNEIIDDGVTGFLINPDVEAALSELVRLLKQMDEDRQLLANLGDAAHAKFTREGFSLSKVTTKLVRLIASGELDTPNGIAN